MNKSGLFRKIILVFALLAIGISMLLLSVYMGRAVRPDARAGLGYSAVIVTTENGLDDMVLLDSNDASELRAGDVIVCRSVNEGDYGRLVYRRIKEVTADGEGKLAFVTSLPDEDTGEEFMTDSSLVMGKELFRFENTGGFFRYLMSAEGCAVCIMLPFAILILMQIGSVGTKLRRYKADKSQLNSKTKGAAEKI